MTSYFTFVDIKPGHVKGAVGIAFTELIDPDTKQMKSADAIREVFKSVGCDLDQKPVVAMCGSGESQSVTVNFLPFRFYPLTTELKASSPRGSWMSCFVHLRAASQFRQSSSTLAVAVPYARFKWASGCHVSIYC